MRIRSLSSANGLGGEGDETLGVPLLAFVQVGREGAEGAEVAVKSIPRSSPGDLLGPERDPPEVERAQVEML